MAREQDQFLDVTDRDAAERLWWDAIRPAPLPAEVVSLSEALGRVLAEDIASDVDVPPFDRSNVDGFAVRSVDTHGASEDAPRRLVVVGEELACGVVPSASLGPGLAAAIATGGVIPRGADAVLMIEHARVDGNTIEVSRPVAPGSNAGFAGTDIAKGELVLRERTVLTSRETGILAAIGRASIPVTRRPVVGILSTGDELVPPGEPLPPASIHDANATLLADAAREVGGVPLMLGIARDDPDELARVFEDALARADLVIVSGGTSKGAGDLSYRILAGKSPGILVHGVALKPGKPVCLGACGTVPTAILPGFPTSAIFTFHEFVAPVIRRLGGLPSRSSESITARMAVRTNSERGRTEYLLVGLIEGAGDLAAYPMGKGSGSVTTFGRADGFVIIPKNQEYLEKDESVAVTPLGRGLRSADLVVIGSHCLGLDRLLGMVERRGFKTKTIWIGSQGGLDAAARGECDLAGIHLLDPATGRYNEPFLRPGLRLLKGYGRMQGLVFRTDDPRFAGEPPIDSLIERLCDDPDCYLVSRNRGSGTRVLIDGLLKGRRPPGAAVEVRSHNAVGASISQGRADWGVAIEPAARAYGLGFRPLVEECYDFVVPETRWDRPATAAFRSVLALSEAVEVTRGLGFTPRFGDDR